MAVRTVDPFTARVAGLNSVIRWRAHARRHPLRYRVAVVAPRPIDIVRSAGGWVFDRSTAGWEVTVLVRDHSHARALQILGATVLDFERALEVNTHDIWPQTLALDPSMYTTDSRVREGVLGCLAGRQIEVGVWGELPDELKTWVSPMPHRISVAARAFKACALRAAGCAGEPVAAEEWLQFSDTPAPGTQWGTRLVAVR
ncbi:hypothetical protein [Nocardia shimofusensis]|uniref:hypothetical protein n=1 Tax=Nocardia shimofusensis TaxID=228596 RepID=UPI000ADAA511|nr:hypothetical protein [Nocardia shimofusensis]